MQMRKFPHAIVLFIGCVCLLILMQAGCKKSQNQATSSNKQQSVVSLPDPPFDIPKSWIAGIPVSDEDLSQVPAESLAATAFEFYEKGNYRHAILYQQLAIKRGLIDYYNFACMHALTGGTDTAIYWLQKSALEEGIDLDWVKQDPDLKTVRKDRRWKKLYSFITKCNAYWRLHGEGKIVVIRPATNKDQPSGIVVGLHGLGDTPESFVRGALEYYQEIAEKNNVWIIVISGTKPTGPRSFVWSDDIDENHLHIQKSLRKAIGSLELQKQKIAFYGFSQGAQAGFELAYKYPDHYCGALVMSAGGSLITSKGLAPQDKNKNQRYIVMCGELEMKGNVWMTKVIAQMAENAGSDVKLKLYEGIEVHGFPDDFYDMFPEWVDYLLGNTNSE